ncbi:MAG TPA: acetoacetate--CoA ligase, partial [Trueperaceae bacterium]|nr:acetoacetate--CoA ligase [Trueperaceae bacterium]
MKLWQPSQEQIESTEMWKFMQALAKHIGQEIDSYEVLHQYSVDNLEDFWKFYSEYIGLDLNYEEVLTGEMPFVEWFGGAEFNYARELLFPKDLKNDDDLAIISVSEMGFEAKLSYAQLRQEVASCAAALKREGLQKGDRVAAIATNTAETTVLFLACSSLGIIFSSCSPDFGFDAANARFSQIEPKLIFAASIYYYGGKKFSVLDTINKLSESIKPKKTILLPYFDEDIDRAGYEFWGDWLEPNASLKFASLEFNHPLYILFSSGTTGLPKAIVHRAGGAFIKHHLEQKIHSDIKAGDRVFYFSTCGWMMWNWLVSALAQAATIIQFDGSPAYPDLDNLWQLA